MGWDQIKDKLHDAILSTLSHISSPFLFFGGFSLSLSPPLIKILNPSWFWGRSPIQSRLFSCCSLNNLFPPPIFFSLVSGRNKNHGCSFQLALAFLLFILFYTPRDSSTGGIRVLLICSKESKTYKYLSGVTCHTYIYAHGLNRKKKKKTISQIHSLTKIALTLNMIVR
jgi:hypothetical protein